MVTGGTGGLEGADRGRSRPRRSPASRSRASARPCGGGVRFSPPVAVGCRGFVWILKKKKKKKRELRCGYDLFGSFDVGWFCGFVCGLTYDCWKFFVSFSDRALL